MKRTADDAFGPSETAAAAAKHLLAAHEKNVELRVKYERDPARFLDSEVDLMARLAALGQTAVDGAPALRVWVCVIGRI